MDAEVGSDQVSNCGTEQRHNHRSKRCTSDAASYPGPVKARRLAATAGIAGLCAASVGACGVTIVGQADMPASFVMPDLVGRTWSEAEPTLCSLGWSGVLDVAPAVRGSGLPDNVIATESPTVGQRVANDERITVAFAE